MISPEHKDAETWHTWQSLCKEARAIAQKDLFLEPLLRGFVLEFGSFQEALAHRLASDLAGLGVPAETYQGLMAKVLQDNPHIAVDAAVDLAAAQTNDPACDTLLHAFLNYKGFHAIQVQRFAHALWKTGRKDRAVWVSNRASLVFGADIHPAAQLGAGIMLDHGSGIVIGETAVVEDGVTILQNVTLGGTGKNDGDRHPKVRRGAMIGAGANIIGNIEIGAFSKVGAGSVVLKTVPPGCTVAGVPAQIVRLHPNASKGVHQTVPGAFC